MTGEIKGCLVLGAAVEAVVATYDIAIYAPKDVVNDATGIALSAFKMTSGVSASCSVMRCSEDIVSIGKGSRGRGDGPSLVWVGDTICRVSLQELPSEEVHHSIRMIPVKAKPVHRLGSLTIDYRFSWLVGGYSRRIPLLSGMLSSLSVGALASGPRTSATVAEAVTADAVHVHAPVDALNQAAALLAPLPALAVAKLEDCLAVDVLCAFVLMLRPPAKLAGSSVAGRASSNVSNNVFGSDKG